MLYWTKNRSQALDAEAFHHQLIHTLLPVPITYRRNCSKRNLLHCRQTCSKTISWCELSQKCWQKHRQTKMKSKIRQASRPGQYQQENHEKINCVSGKFDPDSGAHPSIINFIPTKTRKSKIQIRYYQETGTSNQRIWQQVRWKQWGDNI